MLSIGLATAILLVSVLRSASVTRVFTSPTPAAEFILGSKTSEVNYRLPYQGTIIPGNPLWSVKAARDKMWFLVTVNHLKKAELALLFADKRLAMSDSLFQNKNPGIALSTLTKGEKYLEIAAKEEGLARKEGMDTSSFLVKFALASLKHRQIIEESIIPIAPEEARPDIVKANDYAKSSFKAARDALNDRGLPVPESPFSGD